MRKNITKERLLAGETVYGIFCDVYTQMTVELMGLVGFDFCIIDAEHNPISVESCLHMVSGADSVGVTPIIRIDSNIRQHILRFLDIGAQGVQLPMINTRSDAEAVVQAVKYAPEGLRGIAGTRALDYGLKASFKEYVEESNRQTLVVTQIENREAMQNIEEMITVGGIDVFFVGPMDLSLSMGYPGQLDHPEVQAAVAELARKIRQAGKVAGTLALDAASAQRARKQGFQYLTCASSVFMVKAAKDYLAQACA
jgi:4-hydroxy-2-oxoheptanedioate aldolase